MREFKFKAYIKHLDLFVDVQRINFDCDTIECYLENPDEGDLSEFNFAEIALFQFSGLVDKDNVEIYEGDIVKVAYIEEYLYKLEEGIEEYLYKLEESGDEFIVTFDEELRFSACEDGKNFGLPLTWGGFLWIKIIGSIYDSKS